MRFLFNDWCMHCIHDIYNEIFYTNLKRGSKMQDINGVQHGATMNIDGCKSSLKCGAVVLTVCFCHQ